MRPHAEKLGAEDSKRLGSNPLRLFDSKDPAVIDLLRGAPTTLDFLDTASRAHHDQLLKLLTARGVPHRESSAVVRGLDYYTLTVYEVTSASLGAQNALLGGGRYDDLVAELGGPPTPATGFAIGEDRLVAAMLIDPRRMRPVFFVVPSSDDEFLYALGVASDIRSAAPGSVVETDLTGRGVSRGIARAAQVLERPSQYPFKVSDVTAVILGGNEREQDTVTLKNLRTTEQQTFPRNELAERLGAGRER